MGLFKLNISSKIKANLLEVRFGTTTRPTMTMLASGQSIFADECLNAWRYLNGKEGKINTVMMVLDRINVELLHIGFGI